MMKELKPCPFCGSGAAVFVRDDTDFPYRIQCLNADCGSKTDNCKQYSLAIKIWNKRVDDECLEEEEEE